MAPPETITTRVDPVHLSAVSALVDAANAGKLDPSDVLAAATDLGAALTIPVDVEDAEEVEEVAEWSVVHYDGGRRTVVATATTLDAAVDLGTEWVVEYVGDDSVLEWGSYREDGRTMWEMEVMDDGVDPDSLDDVAWHTETVHLEHVDD